MTKKQKSTGERDKQNVQREIKVDKQRQLVMRQMFILRERERERERESGELEANLKREKEKR